MVDRINMGRDGRAKGAQYHCDGQWRYQRARNVVCAGYPIEALRLLLNSAPERWPERLAHLMGGCRVWAVLARA